MKFLTIAFLSVLMTGCSLDPAPQWMLLFNAAEDVQPAKTVAEGNKAPAFKLASQDGSEISLDQFQGKWVVLYFYPKDFTQGCTIEAHGFQKDEAQYQSKNAVVIGVSLDSTGSHKDFCAKEGLNFKLLSDPDAKVATTYDSLTTFQGKQYAARNTFIIDPDGVVRRVFRGVKPTGHSQEVLSALAELQHSKA